MGHLFNPKSLKITFLVVLMWEYFCKRQGKMEREIKKKGKRGREQNESEWKKRKRTDRWRQTRRKRRVNKNIKRMDLWVVSSRAIANIFLTDDVQEKHTNNNRFSNEGKCVCFSCLFPFHSIGTFHLWITLVCVFFLWQGVNKMCVSCSLTASALLWPRGIVREISHSASEPACERFVERL